MNNEADTMTTSPIPILHVTTGLNTGGAEMMLYKLLAAHDLTRFAPAVVSLADRGTIGPRIEALGIPVYCLHLMQDAHLLGRAELAKAVARAGRDFAAYVRQWSPRLIQGWMYHGNLAASAASYFIPHRVPVAWNIKQSLYDLSAEKPFTQLAVRIGARISLQPQVILYNSVTGAEHHERHGFAAAKRLVIADGFDSERFRPQPDAHRWLCSELGVPADSILIGLIARYHDMKDHPNLVEAARRLIPQAANVHFVLAGRDVTPDNAVLHRQIVEAEVTNHIHLLGERSDVPRLMAGLDILASSSWSEAFPNVIGEAMSCGVPCVVTDVGDSAVMIQDTGLVVPPRDPKGLAAALATLISTGPEYRLHLGRKARQRVLDVYSLPEIVREYEMLYLRLVAGSNSLLGKG